MIICRIIFFLFLYLSFIYFFFKYSLGQNHEKSFLTSWRSFAMMKKFTDKFKLFIFILRSVWALNFMCSYMLPLPLCHIHSQDEWTWKWKHLSHQLFVLTVDNAGWCAAHTSFVHKRAQWKYMREVRMSCMKLFLCNNDFS
jgi:hypothetical protein